MGCFIHHGLVGFDSFVDALGGQPNRLETGIHRENVKSMDNPYRLSKLRTIATWVVAVLFVKVLLAILYEYRWYFPADFDSSSFLIGRRETFIGVYRTAFYAHIISGPVAIVFGSCLMLSGGRSRFSRLHRLAGRMQVLIVLTVVVPSGFVMALQATAGPTATYGFASLSIATAVSATATVYFAIARKFQSHRIWAGRCFVLLCSPLLLRLISGALIVLQFESDWFYRLNAWLSWLIPLAIYEAYVTFFSPLPRGQRESGGGFRRGRADRPQVVLTKRLFNE